MVVYTQTERIKGSQSAVVEFLLVNHPLDCPVCDKAASARCRTSRWAGAGRSRYSLTQRHFRSR